MIKLTLRICALVSSIALLLTSCGCMERFTQKKSSSSHAGETAAEHAAHSHAGETAEEHAYHASDKDAHHAEEHHEGDGHDHSQDSPGEDRENDK